MPNDKRLDVDDFIIIIIIGVYAYKGFVFSVGGIVACSCPMFLLSSCR
jgi:hypothetical protein